MAKITFTADDGSIQEFDVSIPAPTASPTVEDVIVENTDGSSETFDAVAPTEAAPAE